jgi:hypothetical protein
MRECVVSRPIHHEFHVAGAAGLIAGNGRRIQAMAAWPRSGSVVRASKNLRRAGAQQATSTILGGSGWMEAVL